MSAPREALAAFLGLWGEVRAGEFDLWCAAIASTPGDLHAALGAWLRANTRKPLPAEIVRLMLEPLTPGGRARAIIARVAAEHGLTAADLTGPRGSHPVSAARQQAMAELHAAGHTPGVIGRALGGRDHSTVNYGIRAHATRQAKEQGPCH